VAAKPPRPWNPSTSPMKKETPRTAAKVQVKTSTTRSIRESLKSISAKDINAGSRSEPLVVTQRRPVGKNIVTRSPRGDEIVEITTCRDVRPKAEVSRHGCALNGKLGLSPRGKASVAHVLPKVHMADRMPILHPKPFVQDVPRHVIDSASFFCSPSKKSMKGKEVIRDENHFISRHGQGISTASAGSGPGVRDGEKGKTTVERDSQFHVNHDDTETPSSFVADADYETDTESAIPEVKSSLASAEEHVLALNPNITIWRPTPRRLNIASDPVQATVPIHEESLIYQAKQYVAHTLNARSLLDEEDAYQMTLRTSPHVKGQPKTDVSYEESAYQTMLRKAHFKPGQPSQAKGARHNMRQSEREMLPKLQPNPDVQLGTLELHNDRENQEPIKAVRREIHQVNQLKSSHYDTPQRHRNTLEKSPENRPLRRKIRDPESPECGGDTDSIREHSPRRQNHEHAAADTKSTVGKKDEGSDMARTTFNDRLAEEMAFSGMGSRSVLSTPNLGLNKSVRWDPAIIFVGPVESIDKEKTEKTSASKNLERLFENKNDKWEADANLDSLVKTFRQWKKGDKKKLDILLKALREIEMDSETETADSRTKKQEKSKAISKPAVLDPRVPEFNPSHLKENGVSMGRQQPQSQATPELAQMPVRPMIEKSMLPLQERVLQPILNDPAIVEIKDHSPVKSDIPSGSGCDAQIAKKRIIWDNPADGGREAVMLSQRFALEYLEGFMKKYPLTGQKAAVLPKKRLEDMPIVKEIGSTAKMAKMESDAADIQQKLEMLLLKKKEGKAVKRR